MNAKSKNVTFTLPLDLIDKYKQYAQNKFVPSVNAAVREALEQYSQKMEREQLKAEMMKAAQDPDFMKDLEGSMNAFEGVDGEAEKESSAW